MRLTLQQHHRTRELALLNLGIDSKLRGCDLVALKVCDIAHGEQITPRAIIQQKKTGRLVQFEITPVTRHAIQEWSVKPSWAPMTTCSRVAFMGRRTSVRGSTDECCVVGSGTLASTGPGTAPTRFVERRPR